MSDAPRLVQGLGVSVETALGWTDVDTMTDGTSPGQQTIAEQILQAAKAKYDPEQWSTVARPLRDVLHIAERDALVGHVLHTRASEYEDEAVLYAKLLIDPEVAPCRLTTRTEAATSAVQLFIQRCLLGLEKESVVLTQGASREYDWMRNYGVWEATRKIFCRPEDWIEPDLQDDKTPEFRVAVDQLRVRLAARSGGRGCQPAASPCSCDRCAVGEAGRRWSAELPPTSSYSESHGAAAAAPPAHRTGRSLSGPGSRSARTARPSRRPGERRHAQRLPHGGPPVV